MSAIVASGELEPIRPLGVTTLHWTLSESCPSDWWKWLERCGGGFFHSPAAFGNSGDVPLFAELRSQGDVAGIVVGVWRQCRLSRRARHVHFLSAPAMLGAPSGEETLRTLIARLAADGAAEVTMDSFDARWAPSLPDAEPLASRMEYVVSLSGAPSDWEADFVYHHRRHLRRGDKAGWTFAPLAPDKAPDIIAAVQRQAANRAADRGTPFDVIPVSPPSGLNGAPPWGTEAFAAWRDGELLAAALVGWGGRRAFYLQGGSTALGYECDAAVWMHWRIMNELSLRGFATYNLGGNPATAAVREDPAHGLHRFKSGFGPTLTSCQGLHWSLDHGHLRAHRMLRLARLPWSRA